MVGLPDELHIEREESRWFPGLWFKLSGWFVVPVAKENTGCETGFEWSWNGRFGVGHTQVWQLNYAHVL